MSYFHLLLVSILAVTLGTLLLRLCGNAVRFKILKWPIAIWIDILWVWFITTIILYSHPLQNWFWVFIVTMIIYFVANFVIGGGSIGTYLMRLTRYNIHAINIRRRFLLILLYIVTSMVMTTGHSMLEGFDHTSSSSSILLSNQGAMAVDIHGVGTYDLVFMDDNHDYKVDNILYDINKDGKADLEIKQLASGELSWEGVDTSKQLRLILMIGFIMILICLLRYNGWKYRKSSYRNIFQKQNQILQMISIGLVVVLLGLSINANALSLDQAQQALSTHNDCFKQPLDTRLCAGVDEEVVLFFAYLRVPGMISEYMKYAGPYQKCKKEDNCSSFISAKLEKDFEKWWLSNIDPIQEKKSQNSYTPLSTDTSSGDPLTSIMIKYIAFERLVGYTIEELEQHRRWKNFQVELKATHYISHQTMSELEVELDEWRQKQLGPMDWIVRELMSEIDQASDHNGGSISSRLDEYDLEPQLERQLTRLYKIQHSLQWSEEYKKITQQQSNPEIHPYILYTYIRVGEQIIQSNPRDTVLIMGKELFSYLGWISHSIVRSNRTWSSTVQPYLSVIAGLKLDDMNMKFEVNKGEITKTWGNNQYNFFQKLGKSIVAFYKTTKIGREIVLHETLFMSEGYMKDWYDFLQRANGSFVIR